MAELINDWSVKPPYNTIPYIFALIDYFEALIDSLIGFDDFSDYNYNR